MPTYIGSPLSRGESGLGAFPTTVENDIKISKITVADITERDNIPSWKRLSKMEVKVIDATPEAVGTAVYELQTDLTTWTDVTVNALPDNVLLEDDILDGDGYIKSALIRNLFINDSYIVADEAEMLALTTVIGNVVLQTGDGSVWIKLNNDSPADIGDFADITANTGAVTTVNGQTGAVTITMAGLLAIAQNVTDFNNQVGIAPSVTANTAAIVTLQGNITTINNAIATLQAVEGKLIKTWINSVSFALGEFLRYEDSNNEYILYEVIQTTPIGKSPEDIDGTDYFKQVGNYYTKQEIDTALALKADLVSGKIPISQIPTSLLGVQIVADIAARNALSPYEGLRVIVVDASGDPNITSGAAEYVLDSDYPTADSEGFVLIPGSNVSFVPDISGDGTKFLGNSSTIYKRVEAIYKELNLTGHSFVVNDVLARSGSSYVLSITEELIPIGIVVEVIDVNNILVLISGYSAKFTGLTANTKYYISAAGKLTISDTGRLIMQSISTTEAFLFSGGTSGSGTLQSAYDNSTDGEIELDGLKNFKILKNGALVTIFELNEDEQALLLEGKSSLGTDYTLWIVDDLGNNLIKVWNDGRVEFGSNLTSLIEVQAGVTSGNAGLQFIAGQAIAYRFKDDASFDYLRYKTDTDGVGRAVQIIQKPIFNQLTGFFSYIIQFFLETTSTNNGQNVVASIPVASGFCSEIRVQHMGARGVDGNVISADPITIIARNVAGTLTGTNTTIGDLRLGASDGGWNINHNDTSDEVEIRFQNESTGQIYNAWVQVSIVTYPVS